MDAGSPDTIQYVGLHWNAERISRERMRILLVRRPGAPRGRRGVFGRRLKLNSWLTPLRLRSLIGLHEVSAPRGVSGCACREHHSQSRESAPTRKRERFSAGYK